MDRETLIGAIEQRKRIAERNNQAFVDLTYEIVGEVLELLKEQEEREQRICKSICNFIRGACSTDTDDDKDFVCYEIQKCFTEGSVK